MQVEAAAGVVLRASVAGDGEPLVLVHGSFDDLHAWDRVVPLLSDGFRVVAYDRRGHGRSTCPPGQGRIDEDVDDLAAVVGATCGGSAHVAGHSYGATTALLLGARSPQRCRSITVHEPPLFGLLPDGLRRAAAADAARAAELIDSGAVEEGVRHFVTTVGFGPGVWDDVLDDAQRRSFVAHAPTWLDQHRDPSRLAVDVSALAATGVPVTITEGDAGLPHYPPVMEALGTILPDARRAAVEGAGHAPHLTHPERWAALVRETAERSHR